MQKIIPNIWCNGTAEQAGAFYAEAFDDASTEVTFRYPESGLPDFQRELAGEALTVDVTISGTRLTLINAGDEFRPNPSISFMLRFDPARFADGEAGARAAIDRLWAGLNDGSKALMPLAEYPFSAYYGWIEDRYGVSWQLMLSPTGGEPRPFISPALMFDGIAQNRAAEAADLYVSLFAEQPGAQLGIRSPYGAPSGDASAGALAFGEFRIGEQWFVVMDNGSGTDHGFSCGVSLQVDCVDQAEIDRLWDALSSVPEAEACGWCTDRFGVSWQVVPAEMGRLMQRPGAYERLMGMKKLVIAEF